MWHAVHASSAPSLTANDSSVLQAQMASSEATINSGHSAAHSPPTSWTFVHPCNPVVGSALQLSLPAPVQPTVGLHSASHFKHCPFLLAKAPTRGQVQKPSAPSTFGGVHASKHCPVFASVGRPHTRQSSGPGPSKGLHGKHTVVSRIDSSSNRSFSTVLYPSTQSGTHTLVSSSLKF